ncbi:MAG: hypothetical protein JW811_05025 [Clostridiales bacterium]|nr:hypothetical protein [Clostridiales bacterium]
MQYQIDTIPVWEALEYQGSCLLCTLHAKTEAGEIERALGSSVMEPGIRVRTNVLGICAAHQRMMFQNGNRLGHALLMDTHAEEVLKKLEKLKARSWHGRDADGKQLAGKLRALSSRCIVCETINTHMKRYVHTLLYLWKTDPKFKKQFCGSNGVCIPHAADLIEASQKHLNARQRVEFTELCLDLLYNHLAEDEKDLNWFTQKFDYKNKSKSWENSKNAIERTVNRLRGYCLGNVPYEKPKK